VFKLACFFIAVFVILANFGSLFLLLVLFLLHLFIFVSVGFCLHICDKLVFNMF
jgi:hypothetical protein